MKNTWAYQNAKMSAIGLLPYLSMNPGCTVGSVAKGNLHDAIVDGFEDLQRGSVLEMVGQGDDAVINLTPFGHYLAEASVTFLKENGLWVE